MQEGINCECMKRKWLFQTQEESAQPKKTRRDCMAKQRQIETEEQGTKRKKNKQNCMAKQRQTETEEQGAKRKKAVSDYKRRKREETRHQSRSNKENMTHVIDPAMKEAKQFLHRTRDPGHPQRHKATVCIICDRFIIGTETIQKLTKEDRLQQAPSKLVFYTPNPNPNPNLNPNPNPNPNLNPNP